MDSGWLAALSVCAGIAAGGFFLIGMGFGATLAGRHRDGPHCMRLGIAFLGGGLMGALMLSAWGR